MKKKELKKRIKHLQQLTDCLISDNVRLMMRLGDLPCYEEVKERFNEKRKIARKTISISCSDLINYKRYTTRLASGETGFTFFKDICKL